LGRKKGSYKFEKRQKELKKQKKKRDKLDRRQNKGDEFDDEPQPSVDLDNLLDAPAEPDTETETDSEA
jgi:hypothetical protein